MDDKILIPKEEFEKLKADLDRLSVEINLRKQTEEELKIANNELAKFKLSEKKFNESEAKFSTVFQLSPIALSITSLNDQIFLDVNESFLRNAGRKRQEVIGQPVSGLNLWAFHEQRDTFRKLLAEQGKVENFEFEFQDKKGKRGYGLLSAKIIEINNEPCILSQSTIITERKAIEEALTQSEARLNDAQRIAHIGSWELDIVNNILTWSDEIYRIFEIDPEKFGASYEAFLNAIHPEDRDLVNKAYTDSLRDKIPYNIVHRLQMPNGRIKYVNEKCETYYNEEGNPLRSVGTVHDITRRKQAEDALRESEEKYRTLIQKIQTAVVVHGSDTKIITCNAKARELLGLTEDQLLGKTAIDPDWHFYQEDSTIMPLEEYPVNRVMATRQVLRNYILRAHRPNNDNDVWVLVNADPVFGKEGEISQVIVTFIDITDRKHAEEALHQSEWRYREIFDNVLDSLFLLEVTSDKHFRNLEVNPAFEKSTGIPRAELIGKFIEETVPPEVASIVNAKYRHCIEAAHPIEEEAELDLPTGRHYFQSTLIPARDEAGQIYRIIGISRDITERKRAEDELEKYRDHLEALVEERTQQLQKSEFYYRRLFETMFQGVVYQDAKGKVISMNPAAERILGKSYSIITGQTSIDNKALMFREDGSPFPGAEHPAMVALATGLEVRDVVMKHFNPKVNEFRWVSISAMPLFRKDEVKPYQVYTLFNDITESKVAEEALQVSEERMRLFFERQLVGMAITSPEKGWIKVNDKLCEMMGYSREELTRLTWSEMTYPEDLVPDVAQFERLLNGEIDGYTLEKRFVRKDGSIVFTNLLVGCVRRPDRSVDYVLAILENITGRKQAHEQIRQLNEQLAARARSLEQANKELEAFSYSVSHDLRAPLRGIDGFSQILLDEYQDMVDEKGRNYLRRVRSATQRMAQLIDDMLNLSRVSRAEINMKQVNLSEIAISIANELHENQPEREVEFIIQQGIKVHGDGHLLHIVLENLIRNSWKFTSKHTKARIEFGVQTQNDRHVYFVRDDGAGFDMNYARKLFGAFQRLHTVDEFQGTGIGLATVQRVIHRHGGSVWAEGAIEKGATIYFTMVS